jgi:hypothetical protein
MTFIKADEIEIDDEIRITHRGIVIPVTVRDIEYRPRALILQCETEKGQAFSVSFEYGTPIEMHPYPIESA